MRKRTQEQVRQSVHWVIKNDKRHSIWQQPYLSFADAKSEFDYQVSKLKIGQTHNFKIEQMGFIDYKKQEGDKDFRDFDEVTQSALNNF